MNKKFYSTTEIENFKNILAESNSPNVYYIMRRVSKSGMSRVVSFYYFSSDGHCHNLDKLISQLGGFTFNEKYAGVRVHGTGMNMVWYCLYRLFGRLLGPKHEQNFRYHKL